MRHMHATAFALMALVTQPAQTAQTASSVKTLEWMTGCWMSRDGKTSSWPATAFDLEPGANAREAVFANPAHDFPKRVAYRATPTGLFAWIDGGDAAPGRRIEFPMTRVSCDSAPR
jgi:hypothetical protein